MVRIGEDKTERLDQVPACYEVIVTIRPKYACPKGRTGVVQAKAPAHLLEGSWPTEALSGGDCRLQAFRTYAAQSSGESSWPDTACRSTVRSWPIGWAAQGSEIDRWSTTWPNGCCEESTRLYVDETTAPVLDPGRGKTKLAISGPFCVTTAAGMAPRRRAWCSITGPGVKANMPLKSSTGSTGQFRWMPMVAIRTSPRQTAWVAFP
jgi:hypothetical protein